jgi:hypothetical protein
MLQIKRASRQNGHNTTDIHQALNLSLKSHSKWVEPNRVATVSYMQATSDRISRLLARFNMKTVHAKENKNKQIKIKISHILKPLKGDVGCRAPGM